MIPNFLNTHDPDLLENKSAILFLLLKDEGNFIDNFFLTIFVFLAYFEDFCKQNNDYMVLILSMYYLSVKKDFN